MSPEHERRYIQRAIEKAQLLLSLMTAGDEYLATLPEPAPKPTLMDVLSWPEVTQAIQSAAKARAPHKLASSHLSIVEV